MKIHHLLTATAISALMAGSAFAQTPSAAAPAPKAPAASAQAPAKATPAPAAQGGQVSAAAKVTPAGDIVETAKASGQFTTFLKAAEATNLTSLLKTNKNLTVFAPTDAAFAAMPAGELDKLMLPENKAQLQQLVISHVVNAPVTSADFKGSTRNAPTVGGATVSLSGGDKLMVNDANIVQADIAASNGVIHVIDKVLTPAGAMAATGAASTASATAPATPSAPATNAAPASPQPGAKPATAKDPPDETTPKQISALTAPSASCQEPSADRGVAPSPVTEDRAKTDKSVRDETGAAAAASAGADAAAQAPMTQDPAAPAAPPVNESEPAAEPPAEGAPAPPPTPAAPAPSAAAPSGAASDASASAPAVTTTTAAMQPVADTPENRAKYQPLSNAGKRSSAKGN
jgi:uncharacterized surface protein with fasciclin (FAS1) repeats